MQYQAALQLQAFRTMQGNFRSVADGQNPSAEVIAGTTENDTPLQNQHSAWD